MKTKFDGYMASPYYHKDPTVRHARFQAACLAAGWAIKNGLYLYSPIAHTASIANFCDLPHDFNFWEKFDTVGIGSCKDFYILRIPGWDESVGVWREINITEDLGKDLYFIESAGRGVYKVYQTNYSEIVGSVHVKEVKERNPTNVRMARAIIDNSTSPPVGAGE